MTNTVWKGKDGKVQYTLLPLEFSSTIRAVKDDPQLIENIPTNDDLFRLIITDHKYAR